MVEEFEQRREPRRVVGAAEEVLAAAGKLKPKGPDADRLNDLRDDLLREIEIIATSPVDEYEERNQGAGGPKRAAIDLLGRWRNVHASYLLSRQINFVGDNGPPKTPLWCYPAANALVEIGSPGLEAIFGDDRMADGPVDDEDLRLIAWVIYLVDGRDLGLARLNLKLSEIRTFYPRTYPDNLSRLLGVYRGIDFKDSQQWPRPATKTVEKAKSP